MNPKQDRVLGRGLSALISGATAESGANLGDREASMVSLEKIGLNPAQPRKIFKDNTLRELADSIRQVGVLQPILLRRLRHGDARPMSLDDRLDPDGPGSGDVELEYCLVAGERRLRAAQLAGVESIPALICSYEESESLKIALLENIQRVTNTLRLLSLEVEIQDMLQDERITRGHAKVLLGVTEPGARLRLARLCRNRGLSVRECEKRVRNMLTGTSVATRKRTRRGVTEETREVRVLRERVEARFGAPVQVERDKDGRGNIALRFFTDDDMLRILSLMGVDTDLS